MEIWNCEAVRGALWDFGRLPEGDESSGIADHLSGCRECARYRRELSSLRSGMHSLPVRTVSPLLNTRLRVIASREHSRMLLRINLMTWARDRWNGFRVGCNNLLKPFAVPAAGGLLASVLCFGSLVHTLHFVMPAGDDVPVGISQDITVAEYSPFDYNGSKDIDVLVQLSVDSHGNVTDFTLPQNGTPTADELREIGNLVLYSTFAPALRFGSPVSSKRLFHIRHISVTD